MNEEQIIEAIAALMAPVRTSDGWLTDAGLEIRAGEEPTEADEAAQWLTTIYVAEDTVNGGKGSVAQDRDCKILLTVHVDTYARLPEELKPYQLKARIKKDHRRALMPKSAQLLLDGTQVSTIRYMGAEPIGELQAAGLHGVRSRVEAWHTEPITPEQT